jgi:C4-dicarboxylate-specific signal transduction histidine kinase
VSAPDEDGRPAPGPAALEERNRALEQRLREEIERNRALIRLLVMQGRVATMGRMIGTLAHQWRQPLNFIGLILQDIKQAHEHGVLTPAYLDAGVGEGMEVLQRMSRSIGDFRDFFQPDRVREPFSVNAQVDAARALVEASFLNNGVELRVSKEGEPVVEGYPHEYSQALLVLLNFAKDSLAGRAVREPVVSVRVGAEGSRSVLTVTDNAGGLDGEATDRLFDPFAAAPEEAAGAALALFIAKHLVEERMGGRLAARTVAGGTEFTIRL